MRIMGGMDTAHPLETLAEARRISDQAASALAAAGDYWKIATVIRGMDINPDLKLFEVPRLLGLGDEQLEEHDKLIALIDTDIVDIDLL